jgi:hypothetical protein
LVEQTGQLGPVALRPGDLLLVDAPAASLLQRRALQGEVLVVGADTRVANEHDGSVADVVAKCLTSATGIATAESPVPAGSRAVSRKLGITLQPALEDDMSLLREDIALIVI